MYSRLGLYCVLMASLAVVAAAPSVAGQKIQAIRVGIAVMENQSRRAISPNWERDQLIRELKRMRKDRKSSVIIEAVSLDATSRKDAGAEAAEKDCQFFVLTTLLDFAHGPGISAGPGGMRPAPVIVGNANPDQTLAVDFSLLEVGASETLAQGQASEPEEDNNDTRSADEAMRIVAARVASELRKSRPAKLD